MKHPIRDLPFELPNGLGKLTRYYPSAESVGGCEYKIEWAEGVVEPEMFAPTAHAVDVLIRGGTLEEAEAVAVADAHANRSPE